MLVLRSTDLSYPKSLNFNCLSALASLTIGILNILSFNFTVCAYWNCSVIFFSKKSSTKLDKFSKLPASSFTQVLAT